MFLTKFYEPSYKPLVKICCRGILLRHLDECRALYNRFKPILENKSKIYKKYTDSITTRARRPEALHKRFTYKIQPQQRDEVRGAERAPGYAKTSHACGLRNRHRRSVGLIGLIGVIGKFAIKINKILSFSMYL